jgi:Phytanoyl-CoA dioxygenase (PhyH)
MPILTPAQAGAFAERGYVVVPGLVSPADLERAQAEVDRLAAADPPAAGQVGHHFYWRAPAQSPALFGLLGRPGGILAAAAELTGPPGVQVAFGQAQVALNIPPYPHRPGRPHIDGYQPGQAIPGTFTMLAGLLLTGQETSDGGNLWVWPGTHLGHARFFARRGPGAFASAAGYPDIELPEPVQVHGRRGDVLLAHYLLGHNIGGNVSGRVRQALYWRLRAPGHEDRWAECLADPWRDYGRIARQPPAPAR